MVASVLRTYLMAMETREIWKAFLLREMAKAPLAGQTHYCFGLGQVLVSRQGGYTGFAMGVSNG